MSADEPKRGPFLLLALLILAALPVGYFVLLEDAPPPAVVVPEVVTPPEVKKPLEATLTQVSGRVELRRADGAWQPAEIGSVLKASDAIRTLEGSSAVIVGGEAYEVRMEPGTEVSIEELTDSISRLLLGNGMAIAKVKGPARHTFEVKAAGSDAVARTDDGTFAITNNGEGTVAVGTREGQVELIGQGKAVIVRAGQESLVLPGKAPTDPTPIPSSLLLKVRWPAGGTQRKRSVLVAGTGPAGARIEVAGKVVHTDARGDFKTRVRLAEGRNDVSVHAKTVGGIEALERREVHVDTTPPAVGIDPNLWKKR